MGAASPFAVNQKPCWQSLGGLIAVSPLLFSSKGVAHLAIDLTSIILSSILVANIVFAIIVVFFERKRPAEMLAWLLLFAFLPVVGFLFYMFFGQKIFNRLRKLKLKQEDDQKLVKALEGQYKGLTQLGEGAFIEPLMEDLGLIRMGLVQAAAPLTPYNDVTIFNHGNEKFQHLFEDIRLAKDSIHLEYFIWRGNDLGRRLIDALTERAKEGVEVRVVLDDWGCKLTPKRFFRPLLEAGGEVYWFLPVSLAWSFNANYRNHRKIVVIDGAIGYTGGMNVGDEYLGLRPSASPWRDTHIRIVGPAVAHLQARFFMDYFFASGKKVALEERYLPTLGLEHGTSAVQIISSGPDSKEQHVRQCFFKMINSARESLYLQTPYLVPDESILEALRVAAYSGVDVRVMIPGISNNRFVHRVTMAYAGELLEAGVRIYEYGGFLHSKCLVADRRVLTIGTTNLDVRSFALNFEVNAFIYDNMKAAEYSDIFLKDIASSNELTLDEYRRRGLWQRFSEGICRLFAPLM